MLAECDEKNGTNGNRVYYLSTPPPLFGTIAANLCRAALNSGGNGGFARIVIEKPFGWDEGSAHQLHEAVGASFAESQVFRIDQYLAKERSRDGCCSGLVRRRVRV